LQNLLRQAAGSPGRFAGGIQIHDYLPRSRGLGDDLAGTDLGLEHADLEAFDGEDVLRDLPRLPAQPGPAAPGLR